MRGRAILIAGAAAMVLVGISAASAPAALYKGHYKGVKESWGTRGVFNLTVSKVDGKKHVTLVDWNATLVTCQDGTGFDGRFDNVTPPDGKINRHGKFTVDVEYGNGDFARVAGEFRRGKAKGTFKAQDTLDPPSGVCRTGKLRFVAKKR
jgi:hypothetical protein